jgi:hypothetical protein
MDTAVTAQYQDRWIGCSDREITIRGYYFPWGTKHIPYTAIRSVRRVGIGPLTGRGRIWGTANLRYWAGLDPQRPAKAVAFLLDLGRVVQPYVTPEDPDAFTACLREHAPAAVGTELVLERGPFI